MDETERLLHQSKRGTTENTCFTLPRPPFFHIDITEAHPYQMDRSMSGCFSVHCAKTLRRDAAARYFVDGQPAGAPIIGTDGHTVGLFLRKWLLEYDRDYSIQLEGLQTEEGEDLPSLSLTIHTLPQVAPGPDYPQHNTVALQAAREGAVLLKNNGALPLAPRSVVNAFGSGGPAYRVGCVGAGRINPRRCVRFEEGIRQFSSLRLNQALFDFYRDEKDVLPPSELLSVARAASDTAVYIISRPIGEGYDSIPAPGHYYLSENEKALMKQLRGLFKKLVVVLNIGYPIELSWVADADAILWPGLNGMFGGQALAEILEGTVSPSGRLPDTWALDCTDVPAAINYPVGTELPRTGPGTARLFNVTVYEEGLYVGYRFHETFCKEATFPFGHGLSYTTFRRELMRFSNCGADVELEICVTNTGGRPGKESVLLFAQIPEGKLEQPVRRLVGFAKTAELAPGSSELLRVQIDARQFDSYDPATARWIVEPGTFTIFLGGSVSEAEKIAAFALQEELVVAQVKNRVVPPFPVLELSRRDPQATWPKGGLSGVVAAADLPHRRIRVRTPEARPVANAVPDYLITFPMAQNDPGLLDAFVLQMSDYELCRCSAGGKTRWGYGESGAAGELYAGGALAKYKLPQDYCFSDGNNGLNLNARNIGFPTSNVVCATFNESLAYQEGLAIGTEAKARGLMCILAPAANLHRFPLCGRHSEYFSEDPLLAGRMAGQQGRGLQEAGVSSCLKHFFANSTEFLRNTNHAIMSERTARELYLKVFEETFQVYMPDTVMTGYNAVNGAWCGEDEELLEGILREEWGFTGYAMTDWGGGNTCQGGAPAQAGISWVAPGSMDDSAVTPILNALEEGRLDRQRLRANVRDMFCVLIRRAGQSAPCSADQS